MPCTKLGGMGVLKDLTSDLFDALDEANERIGDWFYGKDDEGSRKR